MLWSLLPSFLLTSVISSTLCEINRFSKASFLFGPSINCPIKCSCNTLINVHPFAVPAVPLHQTISGVVKIFHYYNCPKSVQTLQFKESRLSLLMNIRGSVTYSGNSGNPVSNLKFQIKTAPVISIA